MEIAWDYLNFICIGKIEAAGKKLINSFYWNENLQNISCKTPKSFQKRLLTKLPNCEVCARGGMMLSQIRLGNELSDYNKSCDNGLSI